ncbi:MAG: RNA-guided endonuclease TnpB family protein [Chloroflexota bacterium]|nr:RNA-guided endonuclease TnpB family protein [Chloroflexota bacterium]
MAIRAFDPEQDLDRIAELMRQDGFRRATAEGMRKHLAVTPRHTRRTVVAVEDRGDSRREGRGTRIAGYADVHTQQGVTPARFSLFLLVDPAARRRGIGRRLYEDAVGFATAQALRELHVPAWDSDPEGMAFARRRGFEVEYLIVASRLDVARFDAARFGGVVEEVRATGVRLFSLADVPDTPEHRRRLHDLYRETWLDAPDGAGWVERMTDEFVVRLFRPEVARGLFLAAVGDDDEWIGFTKFCAGSPGLQAGEDRPAWWGPQHVLCGTVYTLRVKQTLPVTLAPSDAQHAALVATMERFNTACGFLAGVAFRERCANKVQLQRLAYYDARARFGLSAQLTIRAIGKVVEAYKRDPRVRPRFRPRGAVPYDQRIMSWKGLAAVSLLTLGGREVIPLRVGAYQQARLDCRQGQADLVLRDGRFFLYATLDVPEQSPGDPGPEDYLGLDLGIVNLAADSDGTIYSGAPIERWRRIYQHRRRNLQRKGTRASRRKLRALRGRQARHQRDTNHGISKRVVAVARDTGRGIALEDLKGIRQRTGTVARRQRARHANWAFAQLRGFIEYKAALQGVRVVAVDPRHTSQTCPACGLADKANRSTRDTFRCIDCGLAGPADTIAAITISRRGVLVARAAVMQPNGLLRGFNVPRRGGVVSHDAPSSPGTSFAP